MRTWTLKMIVVLSLVVLSVSMVFGQWHLLIAVTYCTQNHNRSSLMLACIACACTVKKKVTNVFRICGDGTDGQ